MKKILIGATAIGVVLGMTATANAQWYVRGDLGYNAGADDITGISPTIGASGVSEAEADLFWGLGLGYDFSNQTRLELAYDDRYNDLGAIEVPNFTTNSSSNLHSHSLMLNAYYDMLEGNKWQPYVGAGVGIAQSSYSGILGGGSGPVLNIDDVDTGLAWQLLAGVAIEINETWALDAGYRYFNLNDPEFEGPLGAITAEDASFHTASLGLRHTFGAVPAPIPTPVPTPTPTPTPAPRVVEAPVCNPVDFIVYFEWDQSNLTSQAQDVIDAAVAQARECGVSSVRIEGHADKSGSASYNVGLSNRRSEAVKSALVNRGVPTDVIATEAFGETRPAVETPDGKREPLNRRAEVVIRVQ